MQWAFPSCVPSCTRVYCAFGKTLVHPCAACVGRSWKVLTVLVRPSFGTSQEMCSWRLFWTKLETFICCAGKMVAIFKEETQVFSPYVSGPILANISCWLQSLENSTEIWVTSFYKERTGLWWKRKERLNEKLNYGIFLKKNSCISIQ